MPGGPGGGEAHNHHRGIGAHVDAVHQEIQRLAQQRPFPALAQARQQGHAALGRRQALRQRGPQSELALQLLDPGFLGRGAFPRLPGQRIQPRMQLQEPRGERERFGEPAARQRLLTVRQRHGFARSGQFGLQPGAALGGNAAHVHAVPLCPPVTRQERIEHRILQHLGAIAAGQICGMRRDGLGAEIAGAAKPVGARIEVMPLAIAAAPGRRAQRQGAAGRRIAGDDLPGAGDDAGQHVDVALRPAGRRGLQRLRLVPQLAGDAQRVPPRIFLPVVDDHAAIERIDEQPLDLGRRPGAAALAGGQGVEPAGQRAERLAPGGRGEEPLHDRPMLRVGLDLAAAAGHRAIAIGRPLEAVAVRGAAAHALAGAPGQHADVPLRIAHLVFLRELGPEVIRFDADPEQRGDLDAVRAQEIGLEVFVVLAAAADAAAVAHHQHIAAPGRDEAQDRLPAGALHVAPGAHVGLLGHDSPALARAVIARIGELAGDRRALLFLGGGDARIDDRPAGQ